MLTFPVNLPISPVFVGDRLSPSIQESLFPSSYLLISYFSKDFRSKDPKSNPIAFISFSYQIFRFSSPSTRLLQRWHLPRKTFLAVRIPRLLLHSFLLPQDPLTASTISSVWRGLILRRTLFSRGVNAAGKRATRLTVMLHHKDAAWIVARESRQTLTLSQII